MLLADTLGRKKLLILGAICMVVEMLALLFAPMNGSEYVFLLFALNRIVSGLAEAAVSGADEALAYDSLKEAGREKEWGEVLEKAQRYTSLAFFFAMMTGSAFYDSSFINLCLSFIGVDYSFTPEAGKSTHLSYFSFLARRTRCGFGHEGTKNCPKVKRHWKPCGNHLALLFQQAHGYGRLLFLLVFF